METQYSPPNLPVDSTRWTNKVLGFLDSLLRGIGQVMLQNNRYAGLLFLAGIFYNSRLFGSAVLAGTVASTLTAMLLGVARPKIRDGLFGFNGALVAVALVCFFRPDPLAWIYLIFAAATSTILMAAMLRYLEPRKIPPLTAPFVLATLCFLLAYASFGRLHPTGLLPAAVLPQATVVKGVVSASTVGEGLAKGIAQVFFQNNLITGVLFGIGLLISSRRAFLAAVGGSLVGLVVAWGMGAPEPEIRAGVFGFNCVLTAIAIDSLKPARVKTSMLYTLLAVIAATVVYAALSAALQPLGMPALTLPFVLVVWTFVLAARIFPRLQKGRPAASPVEHLAPGSR